MLCTFQKNKHEHNKSELQELAFRHIHNSELRASDTLIFTLILSNQDRYNFNINRPYFILHKLTSRIFRRREIYQFKRRLLFSVRFELAF